MRALATRAVAVPLATIFGIQTVLTMGAYAIPVVIPVAASDLGVEPEAVGSLVAWTYAGAMSFGLASGRLLERFGPTRVFQLLLVLVASGAFTLGSGVPGAAVFGAILIGLASGPMNPSGSTVLVRVAPPDIRALVFSLKQCGTPAGGMLAGMLLPWLMGWTTWQYALMVLPAFALLLLCAAPFGGLGGPDRGATLAPGSKGSGARGAAARFILSDAPLRALTLYGFGFAMCQMALATYLVVYLWSEAGYSPAAAGLVFAVLHLSGIGSRVAVGFVAERVVPTRLVLVAMAFVLAGALGCIAALDSTWPLALVYLVMVVAGASGNGWVGLYFAELARLSPPDRIAEIAAASQFATYLGIVCGPLLFGALLSFAGGYAPAFITLIVLASASGAYVLASPARPA